MRDKAADEAYGFREMVGGPGIKGRAQKRLDQKTRTLWVALGFVFAASAWTTWFHVHGQPKMILWAIPVILLAGVLGLLNVLRNYKDENERLRRIDEGLDPDEDGVYYNSRSVTVNDAIKRGNKIPKGF